MADPARDSYVKEERKRIWEDWTVSRKRGSKVGMGFLGLQHALKLIYDQASDKNVPLDNVPLDKILDSTLTYSENRDRAINYFKYGDPNPPKTQIEAAKAAETDEEKYNKMLQDMDDTWKIQYPEKYVELQKMKEQIDKLKTAKEKSDTLKKYAESMLEAERKLYEEKLKKLKEEKEALLKAPPPTPKMKVRVRRDFQEGIISYRKGQVFEVESSWAQSRIEQGYLEDTSLPPQAPATTGATLPLADEEKGITEGYPAPERKYPTGGIDPYRFDIGERVVYKGKLTKVLNGRMDAKTNLPVYTLGESYAEGEVQIENVPQAELLKVAPPSFRAAPKVEEQKYPGLTDAQVRRLEDVFKATILRELGRFPSVAMSEFRLELENILGQKPVPALQKIEELIEVLAVELAGKISGTRRVKDLFERALTPKPEEAGGEPMTPGSPHFWYAEEAHVPEKELDGPFPSFGRLPGMFERDALWKAFVFEVSRMGRNPADFRTSYYERIDNKFMSWDQVKTYFWQIIDDVRSGRFGWAALESMPKKVLSERVQLEEKRVMSMMPFRKGYERWDAIIYFTSRTRDTEGALLTSMDELLDYLKSWVPNVNPVEVKIAIREAWTAKHMWFMIEFGVKERLEKIIGEPL